MTARQAAQSGFTLFEMLVALALFSLMLGCFSALFYRLERTNQAIARVETMENVDVVRRFLQRSIEGSRTLWRGKSFASRTLRFVGEPARVVFAGVAAGGSLTGGLYESEVKLDGEGRLLLQRRSSGWAEGDTLPSDVLLRGVHAISFEYYPCPSRRPSTPVDHWARTDQLPYMISLEVSFSTGDNRAWRQVFAILPAAACAIAG